MSLRGLNLKKIFVNEDEVFLRSYTKNKKEEILQEYRKTLEKYSGKKETLDTIEIFFLMIWTA